MLKPWQFWTLTGTSGLALVLAITNMILFGNNRALQDQANNRAQYIQQSIALETLYREIVKALADRAVATRDEQVRDILAAEGLNLSFDRTADPAEQKGKR